MDKKKLLEISRKYAERADLKLNPNKEVVDYVIKGLLGNEKKHGFRYCPCKARSGDKKEDAKIICPCRAHKEEIAKMGRCWCGLYVKKGWKGDG